MKKERQNAQVRCLGRAIMLSLVLSGMTIGMVSAATVTTPLTVTGGTTTVDSTDITVNTAGGNPGTSPITVSNGTLNITGQGKVDSVYKTDSSSTNIPQYLGIQSAITQTGGIINAGSLDVEYKVDDGVTNLTYAPNGSKYGALYAVDAENAVLKTDGNIKINATYDSTLGSYYRLSGLYYLDTDITAQSVDVVVNNNSINGAAYGIGMNEGYYIPEPSIARSSRGNIDISGSVNIVVNGTDKAEDGAENIGICTSEGSFSAGSININNTNGSFTGIDNYDTDFTVKGATTIIAGNGSKFLNPYSYSGNTGIITGGMVGLDGNGSRYNTMNLEGPVTISGISLGTGIQVEGASHFIAPSVDITVNMDGCTGIATGREGGNWGDGNFYCPPTIDITDKTTVHATGDSAIGIEIAAWGQLSAYNLDVEATGTNAVGLSAGMCGERLFSSYYDAGDMPAVVTAINGTVTANGNNAAALAVSQGSTLNITNITASAPDSNIAVKAYGNGTLTADGSTLTGDVIEKAVMPVETTADCSFEQESSLLTMNLNNKTSLTGAVNVTTDSQDICKINLNVDKTSTWFVTGTSDLEGTLNNEGSVDFHTKSDELNKTVTVSDYTGSGSLYMNTDLASQTDGDKLVITNGTTAASGTIQVYDKGLVSGSNGKVTGSKQLLLVQDTNGVTSWTGKSLDTGGVWDINPTIEKIGNDWYLVMDGDSILTPNTTAKTYFGFSDAAYGLWRNALTDDTLRMRLGDLRYGAEDVAGVWAKVKAGNLDASGYDADYQMYQGGYDKKNGNTAYGLAVDHMRSKPDYEAGYGHNSMTNVSLYATTYHDSGAYSDIVLTAGKYRGNVHVNPNSDYADYDAWAYSASYEVGKTYRRDNGWFIEPQGQLIYGHMQGTDSISKNGSDMHRDSITSFLGRAGVVLGRKVNDHSDYYFKANIYREFAGDGDMFLDVTDNYGTRQHITHSGDNKDTWFELGLGGNLKLSDSAYMYGDVLKTFGANISKKWQVNVGLRWAIGSGAKKAAPQPVVEPAVEPVQPAPVVQEKQEAYYDSVHFGFDEDQPLAGEAAKVSRFAATAKAHPERTYAMVGNTDSVGTDAYNNDLSKRRVEHVKTLAEQQGVPAAQMQDSYLGKSHPVDTNETEQGRANNRRVDIYEHQ
jgi:outer membrane autotransporter protein